MEVKSDHLGNWPAVLFRENHPSICTSVIVAVALVNSKKVRDILEHLESSSVLETPVRVEDYVLVGSDATSCGHKISLTKRYLQKTEEYEEISPLLKLQS